MPGQRCEGCKFCLSHCPPPPPLFCCLTHHGESLSERHCSSCHISQEQTVTLKVSNIKCASAHRFRLQWENAKKILLHVLLRQSGIRWSVSSRCQFAVETFQALGMRRIYKTTLFRLVVLLWDLRVVFFSLLWQQVVGRYLRFGDFCNPTRFSQFCWPSVKKKVLILPKQITSAEFAYSSYQDLLANSALCWILPLTAVQQTAGDLTHCGWGLNMTTSTPNPSICDVFFMCPQALSSSAQLSCEFLTHSNK